MPEMQNGQLVEANAYQEQAKLINEGGLSASENFIFMSPQLNLVSEMVPQRGFGLV
jgi:hypothetical protein